MGISSAYEIASMSPKAFLARSEGHFASQKEAEQVYCRAVQISGSSLNIVTMMRSLFINPFVYSISYQPSSGISARIEEAKENLLKHYPNLENLLGSIDFCECEHCRSVLSPAAYFVDLLNFLEKSDGGAITPYEVLIKRRPDLPHIELTCENTNTVLPYIDIANEIMECWVANNRKLDESAARDTGDATTDELLAEPQNILPNAYTKLKGALYPLTLPFDLWLETVRQLLNHFEVPLWQLLELFRSSDDLFEAEDSNVEGRPTTHVIDRDRRPTMNPRLPLLELDLDSISASYDRAAIFAEYLGISTSQSDAPTFQRAPPTSEYDIFTEFDSLNWHQLYGYKLDENPLTDLKYAKTLSRRLGVSYNELVDLICTSFVNPRLDSRVILRKLGMDADDVFRHMSPPAASDLSDAQKHALDSERAAFEARLERLKKQYGSDVHTWLTEAWKEGEFNGILVLADPSVGCSFNETTLRYANGDAADSLVFLKLNLFVRLWRRLGWTIDEIDRALQVFLPVDINELTGTNILTAMKTALVYLAHLKALDERLKLGKGGRLKLLNLWADLPTNGQKPLYDELFLSRSVLKDDPVFDHPLGRYLHYFNLISREFELFHWNALNPEKAEDGNVSLYRHLPTVQSALSLTSEEIGLILADAKNIDLEQAQENLRNEPLTLTNLSTLYRYGLLAKALKLSIQEFIGLKRLSGLDPFKPLSRSPLTRLDEDYPFNQTLQFVEVADKINESSFGIEDLEYLLRHRFNPVGKYRTNVEVPLDLIRTLAFELRRIQAEHAVPDDPSAFTDELLQQKLALIMPPDVVETFLAMWTGTIEYKAVCTASSPLDPNIFEGEPDIREVFFNETTGEQGEQYLVFRGVLTDSQKSAFAERYNSSLLNELLLGVQEESKKFFEDHLQKYPLNGARIMGFIDKSDFNLLFAPMLPITENLPETEKQSRREQNEKQMCEKREKLASVFLPYLQQRLSRKLIVETLVASLNADAALTEALLTDIRLLSDPGQNDNPLIDAFISASKQGVSGTFFWMDNCMDLHIERPIEKISMVDIDTNHLSDNLKEVKSARFKGYLEVPTSGAYRFTTGAKAELRFAHLPDPLFRSSVSGASAFIELKAGVPYCYTFEAHDLTDGCVSLRVQGENMPKGSLARLILYPQSIIERVQRSYMLLCKTLQVIQGFGLNEREVRHLLTHRDDFDGLDLSQLPTRTTDASDDREMTLFSQFIRLADYSRLKHTLAGGTDDLIGVFEKARRSYPASSTVDEAKTLFLKDLYQGLADITRRDIDTVRAMAMELAFDIVSMPTEKELRLEAPDFAQEKGILRLWEGLQILGKIGVPAKSLKRWATPSPDLAIAHNMRNVLKAHYEPERWQSIARPIFDKLRQRKRDALVAYIMHERKLENADRLFELFLIDPGMEPVVQTSRIRLAISSVQLFIQRCLLNLESDVRPTAINAQQWDWMKRYRVWEANRKIFLYPENWLEPEFRDDKSYLFQELESALLQGDVSDDLVEDAFKQYLEELEEIACLDIVTLCCEEKTNDPKENILHVIGRTSNPPHRYFYRQYAQHMWTPWEQVTAQIQGDHIVAIVWRDRLHLFWVTFMEKSEPTNADDAPPAGGDGLASLPLSDLVVSASAYSKKLLDTQLNWCGYFQGRWTQQKSSDFIRVTLSNASEDFKEEDVFIHASKGDGEGAVSIYLSGAVEWGFKLTSKNSTPVQEASRTQSHHYYCLKTDPGTKPIPTLTYYKGEGQLCREGTSYSANEHEFILGSKDIGEFSIRLCSNLCDIPSYESQFFYKNNLDTFFIEPTLTEVSILQVDGYVKAPVEPIIVWDPIHGNDFWIVAQGPIEELPPKAPAIIDEPSSFAIYGNNRSRDWVTGPEVFLQFGGSIIGQGGGNPATSAPIYAMAGTQAPIYIIGGGGIMPALIKGILAQRRLRLNQPVNRPRSINR